MKARRSIRISIYEGKARWVQTCSSHSGNDTGAVVDLYERLYKERQYAGGHRRMRC